MPKRKFTPSPTNSTLLNNFLEFLENSLFENLKIALNQQKAKCKENINWMNKQNYNNLAKSYISYILKLTDAAIIKITDESLDPVRISLAEDIPDFQMLIGSLSAFETKLNELLEDVNILLAQYIDDSEIETKENISNENISFEKQHEIFEKQLEIISLHKFGSILTLCAHHLKKLISNHLSNKNIAPKKKQASLYEIYAEIKNLLSNITPTSALAAIKIDLQNTIATNNEINSAVKIIMASQKTPIETYSRRRATLIENKILSDNKGNLSQAVAQITVVQKLIASKPNQTGLVKIAMDYLQKMAVEINELNTQILQGTFPLEKSITLGDRISADKPALISFFKSFLHIDAEFKINFVIKTIDAATNYIKYNIPNSIIDPSPLPKANFNGAKNEPR